MISPRTQVGIAKDTRLSPATVSTAVAELQQEGVFRVETGEGERGKRVHLGDVRGVAVGIEVDHSRVTIGVRRLDAVALEYETADFGPDQPVALRFREAARLAKDLVARIGMSNDLIVSVGVGIPAAVDPRTARLTQVSSSLGWDVGGDLRLFLYDEFPDTPVIVDNEANLAAYGEYVYGAGRNHETMLYVKASTGIGAGLVVRGLIFRGRHGIAGEIGHLTMEAEGRVCRCGNRGCLETVAGGARILEQVRQAYSGYRLDLPTTLDRVVERAKSGDPVCRRVLEDAARTIGLALATVCTLWDPETVVVGGELGGAADLLLDVLRESMRRHTVPGVFRVENEPTTVVASELGAGAGARGALAFGLEVEASARKK
ncbi:ROK family protein [Actinophytocola xanthii]|nr:ROK family protein [Actinophytocola xanthii]